MKAVFTGALLLACVGCADPALITQPVQDEPSLLVGLANHNDPENLELVQHNHPMEWSEADLHTIMARLLVEERGGIMDPFKPPQGESSQLMTLSTSSPPCAKHLQSQVPLTGSCSRIWGSSQKSQALEVTSGGMFLQGQSFHFILSNHRERVTSSEQDGIHGIRSNPLRSLRDIKKGKLSFDPIRYMIDSRDNWIAGGYDAPASELSLT